MVTSRRFVDHHGGDVAQVDRPHLHQVLETTGAGDDEFDTTVERLALTAVADAAVDRRRVVSCSLGEGGELGHDLLGEFTSGGEHERNGSLRAGIGEAGNEREAEAECLAGAGGSAAGDIATGKCVGDDGGLDREGGVLALALEPVHDRIGQAEVAEGNRCVGSVGGGRPRSRKAIAASAASGDVTRGASSMMVIWGDSSV